MDEIINNIFDFLKGNIWFKYYHIVYCNSGSHLCNCFLYKRKKVKEANLYGRN